MNECEYTHRKKLQWALIVFPIALIVISILAGINFSSNDSMTVMPAVPATLTSEQILPINPLLIPDDTPRIDITDLSIIKKEPTPLIISKLYGRYYMKHNQ